ncbi:alpha/beta hydrolase [Octadecabacter sp. R77987]|uniref:alpha/beta hydrolase n=1 Tax=Octadecabacter sp. R77987 TaxID=3093874 RepID=UPI00366F5FD2
MAPTLPRKSGKRSSAAVPSLRTRLLNRWLRAFQRPAMARLSAAQPERARKRFAGQMRLFYGPPRDARMARIGGIEVMEVGPTDGVPILYFHGGGYFFGSPTAYYGFAKRISQKCGLRVILPKYPLAPENPFPAAPDAALRVYRELAAQGPVILAGDSAGGGLALSLLAQICSAGLAQPLVVWVLSPLTDLTLSGDSMTGNANTEVVLPPERMAESRDGYLSGADADDPRASPLFANFVGAAPVRIWVGDAEILYDDSRRMVAALVDQGVDAVLTEEHNLPHVWPIFPGWQLPESEVTIGQISRVVHTSLASAKR